MGSGSTGVACLNTQRNFIGIEKDKYYFDIASNRIEEVKKKYKLFDI
jgi:DNA (cytosine-5-)-methyltransferase